MQHSLSVGIHISGLMEESEFENKAEEWQLLIDSSKVSLKAILLDN